jgi:ABC-type transporter Mla maintaining outer membrane lipid asymmetry permease subunit MlaE
MSEAFFVISLKSLIPGICRYNRDHKTFFFGFFIGMIGCYGFNAENGTASVGQAAIQPL